MFVCLYICIFAYLYVCIFVYVLYRLIIACQSEWADIFREQANKIRNFILLNLNRILQKFFEKKIQFFPIPRATADTPS